MPLLIILLLKRNTLSPVPVQGSLYAGKAQPGFTLSPRLPRRPPPEQIKNSTRGRRAPRVVLKPGLEA